jgi:hypothetical protein
VTAQYSFTEAVERRRAALPPKTIGYVSLAGVVLGMALYATFGPNDVLTGLLVGAVFGGIAANLLIRSVLATIEAWAMRRLELAIVVAGVVAVGSMWYFSR